MKKNNFLGFTLIEVLLSTTIIASVLISGFYALTFISIGKIRLVEATKIEKEGFYFSEKLFEMVKRWWVLDFEEYYNRKIVGNTTFSSGHFLTPTGYGNFWHGGNIGTNTNYWDTIYYCLSPSGTNMWTGGCLTNNNSALIQNHDTQPQRYGQYSTHFIDYNSDYDADGWDEDADWEFIGDDDDKFIGQGPDVFNTNININELYLISGDRKSRTQFRWNVKLDPDRPTGENCDFSDHSSPTGTGCLGTIEFLQLDGKDWWTDHATGPIDANGSQYDGITDTWIVNSRFAGNSTTVAGSNNNYYREKLFPDDISVSDFEIFAYPNKDIDLAWKDSNSTINQSPYIRMKLVLSPSWKKRRTLRWTIPQVEIATTISLSDEFSK